MDTQKIRWQRVIGQLLYMILLSACAKTKTKDLLPQQATLATGGSSIRLFNFINANADVSVNNIPLTNFGSNQATQTGLSYFPAGDWPNTDGGSPFSVPTSLLDKQGKAHIIVGFSSSNPGYLQSNIHLIDTVLQNDPLNPKDFYILFDGTMRVVPRNAAAPAQPDHFKIRILNLMKGLDQVGFYGSVTLTYADGSIVSAQTSGISPAGLDSLHAGASAYVELPLGAYQFKVFLSLPGGAPDFTKQLAELPGRPNFNGFDQTIPGQPLEEAIFPKIRTFKAGATYSIAITKASVIQPYGANGNNYFWYESVHAYRIVTEQAPATNTTYACIDAVNALRLPGVSILVDGYALGSNLAFGQYAGHKTYIWGNHHLQAMNQQGALLAEKDVQVYPNDYLTAWVYLNPGGMPEIVLTSMDMTSTIYQTNASGNLSQYQDNTLVNIPDDGTNGSIRVISTPYNWQARFLNLSEDIPYVTFGNDNVAGSGYVSAGGDYLFPQPIGSVADSNNFAAATINLGRGVTNVGEPYILFPLISNSFWIGDGTSSATSITFIPGSHIIAAQSQPGPPAIIPGQVLTGTPGVPWRGFVANPAMYTAGLQPFLEPGFYSVALIGNVAQAANGQARLIYVKHNQ